MRCKKILLLCILVLLGIWLYLVIDINRRYPSPPEYPVVMGDSGIFQGLTISLDSVELYTYEELREKYPDIDEMYRRKGEAGESISVEEEGVHYILNVRMENTMDRDWKSSGKQSLIAWMLVVGTQSNGVSFSEFLTLNPDYKGTIGAHETIEIKIPYSIWTEYLTMEEAKTTDASLVYSYYPTYNSLECKAEDLILAN